MKVTLITASYNNAATLEQTIQSVLSQSYATIEYIIVDGASTDGTSTILEKFKSQISIIVSEPDKGIYDALNKGIKLAKGDVIGFLHADDLFYDNKVIGRIAEAFELNHCDAVYGNLQYVSKENTNKVIRNWISKPFHLKMLKRGWMPPHPTLYLRKEVYNNYGIFDINYHIAADYDFMLRILSKGIKAVYIPKYFVKMRVGGKSNTLKNLMNKMKEDLKALRKNRVGGFYSLILKNITKVPQFFKK